MTPAARTLVVGLDAVDPDVARSEAAAGRMPALAGFLERAALAPVVAHPGTFVSSHWPTISTGLAVDEHGYACWDEIAPGTYSWGETTPHRIRGVHLWEALSDQGLRVAALNVPHSFPRRPVHGVVVSEQAAHDRHLGPASWPATLLDEQRERRGVHPLGEVADLRDNGQFAPCDYLHRAGRTRTVDEDRALLADLRAGVDVAGAKSLDLLDRGGWDVFLTVLSEGHCAGHQFWATHDPTHPAHEPARRAALGDPVGDIYARLDASLAAHLERAGDDTAVAVLLSHGMGPHYDGVHLLPHLLARLEAAALVAPTAGRARRTVGEVAERLPVGARRRLLHAASPAIRRRAQGLDPAPTPADHRSLAERLWFSAPNNTVVGGIRLNLVGREPAGRIQPGEAEGALAWLAESLLEVVNLDTGRPIVAAVHRVHDLYDTAGSALPDLFVEWNRDALIERVWSLRTGTVHVPYDHWRTGDHHERGLLAVAGPGVEPGPRLTIDPGAIGATIAATVGGRAHAGVARNDLVPGRPEASRPAAPGRRPWPATAAAVRARRAAPPAGADALGERVAALEQLARVAAGTAWARALPVPDDGPLVSVVVPTRNRAAILGRAVGSVLAQTYRGVEVVVVDDGSSDDTRAVLATFGDDRLRVLDGGSGLAASRNVGLDAAKGDIVAYLDDDNWFDVDWCKAIVWAFGEHPDREAVYGARLVDDWGRLHRNGTSGQPWLHFLAWDAEALRAFNRVDMNVLAHRAGAGVRFDEELAFLADWDVVRQLAGGDGAPLAIPVLAAYYTTDAPDRLSAAGERARAAEWVRVDARHSGDQANSTSSSRSSDQ